MSTGKERAFTENLSGMMQVSPAQANVQSAQNVSLQNQFGMAAMASSPITMPSMQSVINAPEPIVVPSVEAAPDLNKPEFQTYRAEATGDFLRNSGFSSNNMGDTAYLCESVASVTMDLFGSLQDKTPEMNGQSFDPNAPERQLALNNFGPRGPSPTVFAL